MRAGEYLMVSESSRTNRGPSVDKIQGIKRRGERGKGRCSARGNANREGRRQQAEADLYRVANKSSSI